MLPTTTGKLVSSFFVVIALILASGFPAHATVYAPSANLGPGSLTLEGFTVSWTGTPKIPSNWVDDDPVQANFAVNYPSRTPCVVDGAGGKKTYRISFGGSARFAAHRNYVEWINPLEGMSDNTYFLLSPVTLSNGDVDEVESTLELTYSCCPDRVGVGCPRTDMFKKVSATFGFSGPEIPATKITKVKQKVKGKNVSVTIRWTPVLHFGDPPVPCYCKSEFVFKISLPNRISEFAEPETRFAAGEVTYTLKRHSKYKFEIYVQQNYGTSIAKSVKFTTG